MSDDGDYLDEEVDIDDDGDSDEVDVDYDEDILESDDHDDEHGNYDYDDRDGNGGACYDDNHDAYYYDEDADADDDDDNDINENDDDDDTDNYDDDNNDAYNDDEDADADADDADDDDDDDNNEDDDDDNHDAYDDDDNDDDDDDVDADDDDDDDDDYRDKKNSGIAKKEMEQEGKTTKTSRKRALNVAKKSSNNKNRKKLSSVNINPKIIRKFSAGFVRISKSSTRWARRMATTYLEKIHKYCREESKGIYSHFEYTGSFYEHLKTEDANELDILVALDTKMDNAHLEVKEVVPGYARIKVTKRSSKYWRFVEDKDGYVVPKKVISWFFGLVQKAIDKDSNKDSSQNSKQVKVPIAKVSENGPAATLIINDQENCKMTLNVDLVPTFLFKANSKSSSAAPDPLEGKRRFVAKPLPEQMVSEHLVCSREMLWRRSFSLEEKKKMEHMDKNDKGCRREVVKVLKTIVKNDRPPLAILSSYHIKTAFLHYNFDEGQKDLKWGREHLAERFKGLMEYLRQKVSEKCLSHFFIDELNLLLDLSDESLENIEGRLNRLINNENEFKKVLKQPELRYKRKHKKRKLDDDDDDDDDAFHDDDYNEDEII